ncbi:uncharacterized protein LOC113146995 [Cyclospora cayetanensis]|uniref:Uncharacterized protein LOC113146995 n=1 Tax=Cyclospora cayetanensis TaxID=88456 RepID=A0A6P6RXI7_9EIME|nr:uncharacterized protein LOC113146995 [Cyclospora cayetanensis]
MKPPATVLCRSAVRAACFQACAAVPTAACILCGHASPPFFPVGRMRQEFRRSHSAAYKPLDPPAASAAAASATEAVRLPSACLLNTSSLIQAIPQLPPQLLGAAARRLLLQGVDQGDTWRILGARAAETAAQLTAHQCAAILKYFAARGYRDFRCFNALTGRLTDLVSLDGSSSLGSEAVVSLLTAFAALQFRDELVDTEHSGRIAASLKPKDLANTAHALAKLSVRVVLRSRLFAALAAAAH